MPENTHGIGSTTRSESARELDISDSATPEEAAAIAAAVDAYLSAEAATVAAASSDDEPATWDGDRWRFRGRMAVLGDRVKRVPESAPRDPWRAAGRTDRF